jgi:hypothetical protein
MMVTVTITVKVPQWLGSIKSRVRGLKNREDSDGTFGMTVENDFSDARTASNPAVSHRQSKSSVESCW